MIDSLRNYRDIFSYALLGVAAATLLANFIALLDDRTFSPGLGAGSVLVVALAVAIAAPRKDDLSQNARIVTIAAISVLGVSVVLWLWGLFKALGNDLFDAKASFVIEVLGTLVLNALALFAAVTVLKVLPAPVRAQQQPQQWGGPQQSPWGQQGGQQQGWPQQPAQQQWGDQGGWPQQGVPQQPSSQGQAPAQQSWQPYAAGAAGAAAGYGAAEAAQQAPAWGAPAQQQPQTPETPAPVEPAEQSTAVWTPPSEQPSTDRWTQSPGQEQQAPAWGASQPEQQSGSGWGGTQDAGWGGWSQQAEQPAPNAWAQEATEQPTWQPPTEYGSTWPQAPQEQQSYGASEQPAQQGWQSDSGGWGSTAASGWSAPAAEPEAEQPVSRLGDATFDTPETETTYEAGSVTPEASESSSESASGENGDDDEPRPSSWWSPGSPS